MIDIGVIAAAGKGMRAYPSAQRLPKVLFKIGEKTLLQRNIEIMREQLSLREIYIIIGYLGDMIKETIGNGSTLGVAISYIECKDVEAGLAKGIYLAKDVIKSNFVLLLGDEFYINTNHDDLKKFSDIKFDAVCGVTITGNAKLIQKNYLVVIENDHISALIEKPKVVDRHHMGIGTFLLSPKIFDYIDRTKPSERSGRVEMIDVIDKMAREGTKVYPYYFKGGYVNVNTSDDLNAANYIYRGATLKKNKISLIIPAYNEETSIGYVIDDFKGCVDEIIVADNSSKDKTAEIAREKGAIVVSKSFQGYGDALRCGMDHASGDVFILVEADATFRASDLPKMLEYLKDSDMVIGTRTTKQLIEQGANMDFWLRWGNVIAAKVTELLWIFDEPRFTDMGCTYRAIWKDVYYEIRERFVGIGPEFSPEMMVELLRAKKKVIEIPIVYKARIGGLSKHSGSALKILKTGIKMMMLVLRKRFNMI
jgi:NDP-sugar pyrophosphorylase family protein